MQPAYANVGATDIVCTIDGNFDRSAGPIKGLPGFIGYTTREEIYSQHAIYMPYTSPTSALIRATTSPVMARCVMQMAIFGLPAALTMF